MTNELILIKEITEQTFTKEGAERLVAQLENIANHVCADVSTKEGVDEIRSMAAAFGRCKAPITEYKKGLTEEFRVKTNAINAQGKYIIDNITELQAKVRKPLTDLENIEKAKKEKAIQEAAEKLARLEKMEEEIKAKEAAKKEDEERKKREAEIAQKAAEEAKRVAEAEFKMKQEEIANKKRHQEEEERKRIEDVEYRKKIHNEILNKLSNLFISKPSLNEDKLKYFIKLIAKGEVPHLHIKY